jgi:hypothetical protein
MVVEPALFPELAKEPSLMKHEDHKDRQDRKRIFSDRI